MLKFTHPLSKYGLAIVLYRNKVSEITNITHQMLIDELKNGLRHFRHNCISDPSFSEVLVYEYLGIEDLKKTPHLVQSAGLSNQGKYLATNIIAEEKSAKHTYNGLINLIAKLETNTMLSKSESLTMSIAPVSGKINNGKSSQSNPSSSLLEVTCSAIAATTPLKACFSFNGDNIAIIPDLEIEKLILFIRFYQEMLSSYKENLLKSKSKEGKYRRPLIFRGNYPDAPFNPLFGAVGLIAAIGKWSKEAEYYDEGLEVLNFLKEVPLYLIGYGTADITFYNHYIIELAKGGKLRNIVQDLEKSTLVAEERKTFDNPKYKQFFLFSSRFLQLFNEPSFKDFLSFRAHYEPELIHLLNLYFIKIMEIPQNIVTSAKEYGKWLNYVAYYAGQAEERDASNLEKIKSKSKFLIELESAVYSSDSGSELVSLINIRAGRLMHHALIKLKKDNLRMDAPPEATEFLEAAAMGKEISLKQAQHLITAFSRLRNKFENFEESTKKEMPSAELE